MFHFRKRALQDANQFFPKHGEEASPESTGTSSTSTVADDIHQTNPYPHQQGNNAPDPITDNSDPVEALDLRINRVNESITLFDEKNVLSDPPEFLRSAAGPVLTSLPHRREDHRTSPYNFEQRQRFTPPIIKQEWDDSSPTEPCGARGSAMAMPTHRSQIYSTGSSWPPPPSLSSNTGHQHRMDLPQDSQGAPFRHYSQQRVDRSPQGYLNSVPQHAQFTNPNDPRYCSRREVGNLGPITPPQYLAEHLQSPDPRLPCVPSPEDPSPGIGTNFPSPESSIQPRKISLAQRTSAHNFSPYSPPQLLNNPRESEAGKGHSELRNFRIKHEPRSPSTLQTEEFQSSPNRMIRSFVPHYQRGPQTEYPVQKMRLERWQQQSQDNQRRAYPSSYPNGSLQRENSEPFLMEKRSSRNAFLSIVMSKRQAQQAQQAAFIARRSHSSASLGGASVSRSHTSGSTPHDFDLDGRIQAIERSSQNYNYISESDVKPRIRNLIKVEKNPSPLSPPSPEDRPHPTSHPASPPFPNRNLEPSHYPLPFDDSREDDESDSGTNIFPHSKIGRPRVSVASRKSRFDDQDPYPSPSEQSPQSSGLPDPSIKGKRGRPRKHAPKIPLPPLYVFIRNMLHNKVYNPRTISWVNETSGVFKVNNTQEFASTWGKMKSNRSEEMNYEKMSRAMRYHYGSEKQGRKGHLAMVKEKRLVYRFGELAVNWRTSEVELNNCDLHDLCKGYLCLWSKE